MNPLTIANPPNWNEATQALQTAQSILLVTHIAPDGDAIGSLLGLGSILRQMGKTVTCAVDDTVSTELLFLPGVEAILHKLKTGKWDLLISLDASDEERTGAVGEYGRKNSKRVINLDHHLTNTLFGDIFLIEPQAVSATEVIFHWLQFMDVPLTREIAVTLLTGLVTDTLGFRTSNVTVDTLEIAQILMQAGASLTEITERALESRSFATVNLWKLALSSVQLYAGGVIALDITQENLKQAGLPNGAEDTGLVGFLIRVNEAKIAAVLKEKATGEIVLGLRSKPGFDVSEVAFSLGGGGHKQAAGATIPGPLEEAKKRVLPLLEEAASKGKLVIG